MNMNKEYKEFNETIMYKRGDYCYKMTDKFIELLTSEEK